MDAAVDTRSADPSTPGPAAPAAQASPEGAAEARRQLEQSLRELADAREVLESEHAEDSSELSHVDQHPADTATEISDLDRENALLEHADARREEVEAALARLDDGTWGTCADCGGAISEARLAVRPEAARCVDCQSAHEARTG